VGVGVVATAATPPGLPQPVNPHTRMLAVNIEMTTGVRDEESRRRMEESNEY
jgi:hypothetical protein